MRLAATCRSAPRPCLLSCHGRALPVKLEIVHRSLRQAAKQAAAELITHFSPTEAQLASKLVQNLIPSSVYLELSALVSTCSHVPAFIAATAASHVSFKTYHEQSAEAAKLLPACHTITWLVCKSNFYPEQFPRGLKRLTVCTYDSLGLRRLVAALPACRRLRRLELDSPAISLPAAYAAMLPPELRSVLIRLELLDDTESQIRLQDSDSDDSSRPAWPSFQLGAFSAAAGCSIPVTLQICAERLEDVRAESLWRLHARLHAVPAVQNLQLHVSEACVHEVCCVLSSVTCTSFWLRVYFYDDIEPGEELRIAKVPVCLHLGIDFSYSPHNHPLRILWNVLAGTAGCRHLGSQDHMLDGIVHVEGCTGLPAFQEPWVLVVWTKRLDKITGLPLQDFVQEQPCAYVWRSAAAAGLQL